jgi:SAM-dependent methyltransferase
MPETQPPLSAMSEQRRAEWLDRMDGYARDATPKTRPFAEALVAMVAPPPGARVLDVATGSGSVAVEAGKRVGPGGSVLATDFMPEWEPYVARLAADEGLENIAFATMPAEALDLPDASFDAVLCQFGLMFVSDRVQALREMRRVLRPGGRLGVSVWSVPETVGIFLISRIVGSALPPPAGEPPPPSPMALGEPGLIEGLVAEAGFGEIVVERVTRFATVVDAEEEWRRWSDAAFNPAAQGLASLPQDEQDRLRDEAIAALEAFREGEVMQVPSEAIVVTASC